jgi:hypothetical protein
MIDESNTNEDLLIETLKALSNRLFILETNFATFLELNNINLNYFRDKVLELEKGIKK